MKVITIALSSDETEQDGETVRYSRILALFVASTEYSKGEGRPEKR